MFASLDITRPCCAVILLVVHSHHVSSLYVTPLSSNLSILYSIVDHTTLSVGDVWDDYYDVPMDSGDGETRYQSPSRSYISRDMNDEEIDAFVLEHTRKRSAKDGTTKGVRFAPCRRR